ncbi:MBL fold metallo-hydrolase [Actinoplanes oblitus]|uniref:MBL fold metallo-hydrolase n=1 Tax=Actinoplanes oblitus TaxID=3040509 RepID=A0ABY8WRB4_9ACTN|nr:MBL fold metallo-hydrolase [Actinoplanes oblitus]WIM99342.1 MBL fold metallo-hydrolase [Actinoplanes oblitus]
MSASSRVSVRPIAVAGRHSINAYLLLGRRPVLVDAGLPGTGRRIVDGIAGHGVDPADLALIVLTHAHIDHFGAAAHVSRLTGAPIAAHRADLVPYRAGRAREPYLPTGPFGAVMSRLPALHHTVQPVEPEVVLDGPQRLDDFGVAGSIMPTPGHTAGSVSVLTDAGDLVAGDLVASPFLGSITGRPANPPFHDDPVTNLASLRAMLALKPVALHVGHGGRLDPDRVARWADRQERRLDRLAARGRIRHRPAEA